MSLFKICLIFLLLWWWYRSYLIWEGRPQRESSIFIISINSIYSQHDVLILMLTLTLWSYSVYEFMLLPTLDTVEDDHYAQGLGSSVPLGEGRLSTHIIWNSYAWEIYWPHLFIYSNNSISIDSRILTLYVEIYPDLLHFLAQIILDLDKWKTISLNIYIQSLKISPLKWTIKWHEILMKMEAQLLCLSISQAL